MNKVIITGRSRANCGELESLLFRHGMSSARPSRREGLLPVEMMAAMIHANRKPARAGEVVDPVDSFAAVEPGPVWKELMLDLLLGNSDQNWWGWSAPDGLPVLDFWRKMDDQAVFVLVYDEPHSVFDEPGFSDPGVDAESLFKRRLDEWAAFHRALLRFFLQNPERSLLVSGSQVLRDEGLFVSQVRARLGLGIESKERLYPNQREEPARPTGRGGSGDAAANLVKRCEILFGQMGKPAQEVIPLLRAETTERFIISRHLAEHPQHLEIYQELQAAANIPGELDPAICLSGPAWQSLADMRRAFGVVLDHALESHRTLSGRQQAASKEKELLEDELQQLRKRLESEYLISLQTKRQSEEMALLHKSERERFQKQLEAKKLQILSNTRKFEAKIAKCQKQIENHLIKIGKLRAQLEASKSKAQAKAKRPTGAANRVKSQLSYRLGAVLVSHSGSLSGWLGMPFAMRRACREFQEDRRKSGNKKLPPLREYADWEEAKRIENHLSYRLGKTLVEKGRSPGGWISLPFALVAEARRFKQSKRHPGAGQKARR